MAYDGRILRLAREQFEADREKRRTQFVEQREALFRMKPRLREVDAALRSTTGQILSAALRRGEDPKPELDRIRRENLLLQAEKKTILDSLHLPRTCLEEIPACPLCNDTGYRGGEMCRCFRTYYAREQQKELSQMLDVGRQSFETFSLSWYSDRYDETYRRVPQERMREVFQKCREFAAAFGTKPQNLMLWGDPGLGKTFLSAAIAKEVCAAGYSVVYETASHIFERFEQKKFTREEDAEHDVNRVLKCDLLILDDLGTEMTTAFVISALYEIVNTRLLEHRSTILNSNLSLTVISERYSPQIASRLEGEYQIYACIGEDIRRLKKQRQGL